MIWRDPDPRWAEPASGNWRSWASRTEDTVFWGKGADGIGSSKIETQGGSHMLIQLKGLTRDFTSWFGTLMLAAKLAEGVHEEKRSQARG